MAVKGRNKPRTSKSKKGKSKEKTTRNIGNTVKRLTPRIIGSLMGPSGSLIGAGVAGAMPPRDMPRDMPRDKPKSTSPRPKVRPKNVPDIIPRPKPRPSSLRPKIRPTKKSAAGGSLKPIPEGNKGLKKLPTAVRNKMGFMQKGGSCKGMGAATRGGKFSRNG